MRLLRLEVQDLKRFAGAPRAVAFDARATVLHGANEAGKSTLFEAVRHALFDRSRTNAGWVKGLVPYGSGALPRVGLEFEHGGKTWRVEKRFGAKGEATLQERNAGGSWNTLARNEDAEEKLLGLLGATASGARDGSPRENWGVFQWLLVPQELRTLPGAEAAGCLGLDTAGLSDAFERVRDRVQRDFERVYTATGRLAAGADLATVRDRIGTLDAKRVELERDVARLAELRREYEEKNSELPRLDVDAEAAKKDWDEAQADAEGLVAADGAWKTAMEALRGAKDRAEAAGKVLAERTRLEATARQAEDARVAALSEDVRTKEQFARVEQLWNEARQNAGRRGDAVADLRRKAQDAERCARIRDARREVEGLRDLLRRAEEADAKLVKATAAAGEEPPTAKEVSKAQELSNSIREKRATAQGAGLHVQIEGQIGLRVLADGTEVVGAEAVALDAVVVEAQAGRITVRGDTARAQALADEARDTERKLEKALAQHGVADVEALRALREDRIQRRAELETAHKAREAVDPRSAEELTTEIAARTARAEEDERLRAEAGALEAHDALSDEALRGEVRRLADAVVLAEKEFEAARRERERLNEEFESKRKAHEEATGKKLGAEAAAKEAGVALDRHRDQNGSKEGCREEEQQRRSELEAAVAGETETRQHLERISSHAETRRASAKLKYERLDDARKTVEADVRRIAETLDHESVRGAYSQLGVVERTLVAERAREGRLSQAAEAVKHLRDTIESVRSTVVRRVVAPIKGDLDGLLTAASGGRYTLAGLDDALRPGTLSGAAGVVCEFEGGSQGLRELVATLVRVAVARNLARTEPQVVILDDPCVHVSRERTARLVDILNGLTGAGAVQVVLLTHRQSEFAGLLGSDVNVAAL